MCMTGSIKGTLNYRTSNYRMQEKLNTDEPDEGQRRKVPRV